MKDLSSALKAKVTNEQSGILKLDLDSGRASVVDQIHENISYQSLSIALNIYSDWSEREKTEAKERAKTIGKVMIFVIIQFCFAGVLVLLTGLGFLVLGNEIFISYFAAVILQFIALLLVMVKYLYNERSTNCLEIVEKILNTANTNNQRTRKNTKGDYPED